MFAGEAAAIGSAALPPPPPRPHGTHRNDRLLAQIDDVLAHVDAVKDDGDDARLIRPRRPVRLQVPPVHLALRLHDGPHPVQARQQDVFEATETLDDHDLRRRSRSTARKRKRRAREFQAAAARRPVDNRRDEATAAAAVASERAVQPHLRVADDHDGMPTQAEEQEGGHEKASYQARKVAGVVGRVHPLDGQVGGAGLKKIMLGSFSESLVNVSMETGGFVWVVCNA